jgi:hypothetical protein
VTRSGDGAVDAKRPSHTEREGSVTDRRRWPRFGVTWSVELFAADVNTIVTKTVDVSLYGVRLAVSPAVAAQLLRPGETYRFEVRLPGGDARFVRLGEVCGISEQGVGLRVLEPLPAALIQSPLVTAGGAAAVIVPPTERRSLPAQSVLALLRALANSRR